MTRIRNIYTNDCDIYTNDRNIYTNDRDIYTNDRDKKSIKSNNFQL